MKITTDECISILESLRNRIWKMKEEKNYREVQICQNLLDKLADKLSNNEKNKKSSNEIN